MILLNIQRNSWIWNSVFVQSGPFQVFRDWKVSKGNRNNRISRGLKDCWGTFNWWRYPNVVWSIRFEDLRQRNAHRLHRLQRQASSFPCQECPSIIFNSIFINLTTGYNWEVPQHIPAPIARGMHVRYFQKFPRPEAGNGPLASTFTSTDMVADFTTLGTSLSWFFAVGFITACIQNEHILQTTTRQKKHFFVGSFWLDIGLQLCIVVHMIFLVQPTNGSSHH